MARAKTPNNKKDDDKNDDKKPAAAIKMSTKPTLQTAASPDVTQKSTDVKDITVVSPLPSSPRIELANPDLAFLPTKGLSAFGVRSSSGSSMDGSSAAYFPEGGLSAFGIKSATKPAILYNKINDRDSTLKCCAIDAGKNSAIVFRVQPNNPSSNGSWSEKFFQMLLLTNYPGRNLLNLIVIYSIGFMETFDNLMQKALAFVSL